MWKNPAVRASADVNLPVGSRLYFTLPGRVAIEEVANQFGQYGTVETAGFIPQKNCGFVKFVTAEEAAEAIANLHNQLLFGQSGPAHVAVAQPRVADVIPAGSPAVMPTPPPAVIPTTGRAPAPPPPPPSTGPQLPARIVAGTPPVVRAAPAVSTPTQAAPALPAPHVPPVIRVPGARVAPKTPPPPYEEEEATWERMLDPETGKIFWLCGPITSWTPSAPPVSASDASVAVLAAQLRVLPRDDAATASRLLTEYQQAGAMSPTQLASLLGAALVAWDPASTKLSRPTADMFLDLAEKCFAHLEDFDDGSRREIVAFYVGTLGNSLSWPELYVTSVSSLTRLAQQSLVYENGTSLKADVLRFFVHACGQAVGNKAVGGTDQLRETFITATLALCPPGKDSSRAMLERYRQQCSATTKPSIATLKDIVNSFVESEGGDSRGVSLTDIDARFRVFTQKKQVGVLKGTAIADAAVHLGGVEAIIRACPQIFEYDNVRSSVHLRREKAKRQRLV